MKILWAFSPFEKNKKLHQVGKKILTALTDKSDQVQVVYVASNAEVNLVTAYNIPKIKRYSDYPKKLIKKELLTLGLKKWEVEILPTYSLSQTSAVKMLSEFAQEYKVDLIVSASNGQTLLPRLVFGSFAETLIHLSLTDVLFYHQLTRFSSKPPKNILYAHDFAHKGAAGLKRALLYAKKWNSKLCIIHIINPEYNLLEDNPEAEKYRSNILKLAHKMERSIEAMDIDCTIMLEPRLEAHSKVILSTAKKQKADMIIMTAKSGDLVSLMGGKTTRAVLRESTLLTMVLKV